MKKLFLFLYLVLLNSINASEIENEVIKTEQESKAIELLNAYADMKKDLQDFKSVFFNDFYNLSKEEQISTYSTILMWNTCILKLLKNNSREMAEKLYLQFKSVNLTTAEYQYVLLLNKHFQITYNLGHMLEHYSKFDTEIFKKKFLIFNKTVKALFAKETFLNIQSKL